MSGSPSRKRLRQCIHVGGNVTLRGCDVDELRGSDCEQLQTKQLIHSGTQTTGTNEESKSGLESELYRVKEELRNAENNNAYLVERMTTYRRRWLEEYYRADNLERYMPYGVCVPDIGQISNDAASPTGYLACDIEGSEKGVICESAGVILEEE
ncbi:hypothetical protein C8R48DRAFT_677641 [Suillus tomentosus]|nr:hypothetical protein C8R48DRAFT_677641 [Suillus tomentosus]